MSAPTKTNAELTELYLALKKSIAGHKQAIADNEVSLDAVVLEMTKRGIKY